MKLKLLSAGLAALVIGLYGCESGTQAEKEMAPATESTAEKPAVGKEMAPATESTVEKPAVGEAVVVTMEATVAAVNQDTREVTLKDADGNTQEIIVGEEVKNLPQVEVGDMVTVEYMEAVTIEVLGPEGVEPGAAAATAMGTAEPGQKPGGAEVQELVVVAVIEAINKESEEVTLKGPEGNSKTVKVRNPANLEKVAVGDNVVITFTRALAINVTEKPAM